MTDSYQAIVYREGTHRIATPEQTLLRVLPHMAAMGITRIANVTGLDNINIPVVMVYRPNARSISVSQGKGRSLEAAKASGLMESIEGYHAEHITLPLRIATAAEMAACLPMVSPEALPTVKDSHYHRHYPIAWIEAVDLMSGCSLWLPYEMVHTNFTYPRPSGSGCFPASSNGLASGNSIAEAAVHAICEVIERDAVTLWHQLAAQSRALTGIDQQTITSQLCIETLDTLDAAGQETHIWDITPDSGIPSYVAVITDQVSATRHIGVGSGTHLSREVALLRSLHEAVQVRTTYIVGARDDISPNEYGAVAVEAKHAYFNRIISQSTFVADYSATVDCCSKSIERDLYFLLQQLRSIGIDQVLQVDLTKSEFDIPVVRIVIPGLEPAHDDEQYVPGERAIKACL